MPADQIDNQVDVYGGVDIHRDVHVAAVVDTAGRVLGTAPFEADPRGYEKLEEWLRSRQEVVVVSGLWAFVPAGV